MKIINHRYIIGFLSCLVSSVALSAVIHDPTQPGSYTDEGANPWQLSAIIISNDRRIAVINGAALKVGDIIEGQKVIMINPGVVTLKSDDGEMTLQLIDHPIKHISDH